MEEMSQQPTGGVKDGGGKTKTKAVVLGDDEGGGQASIDC